MYALKLITGRAMRDRTLCLTYDDGPSSQTLPLGEYLHRMGCPATFFALGRHAEQFADASAQLRGLGHRVGNHSYSHPDLVKGLAGGNDHAGDIRRTDLLIRDGAGPVIYFRPPFGSWSAGVAEALNVHAAISDRHAGPIYWDCDSRDWDYCSRGGSPKDCADFCLGEIELRGRGIVLMHDGSADRDSEVQGQFTLRATQLLVPSLLERGYRFVTLDEIPEVAALGEPTSRTA